MSKLQARLGNIFGRPQRKEEVPKEKGPPLSRALPALPPGRPPDIDWYSLADTFLFAHGNAPDEKRTQGVFHPSAGLLHERGHCLRNIVFDLLCAPRSATRIEPKLLRIFENGHNREVGLDKMFREMAEKQHCGIVKYESQVPAQHPRLPIAGTADARITMRSGHRYILDYKTINKARAEKLTRPSDTYLLQLNTYMGMLEEKVAYLIYEIKDSQDWVKPLNPNFRIDFDPELYAQTEEFCEWVMNEYIFSGKIPEYDEQICKGKSKFDACITFCNYVDICEKHRKYPKAQKWDWRSDVVKKRHLKVIQ